MKYMLLMNHGSAPGVPPVSEWATDDMKAHGAAMMAIHKELVADGEFVGAEALAGPGGSKIVTHDGPVRRSSRTVRFPRRRSSSRGTG